MYIHWDERAAMELIQKQKIECEQEVVYRCEQVCEIKCEWSVSLCLKSSFLLNYENKRVVVCVWLQKQKRIKKREKSLETKVLIQIIFTRKRMWF